MLTFEDIEIENKNFYHRNTSIFKKDVDGYLCNDNKDVDIEKELVSNKISFGEKTITTLLVTCVMIIKLNHYI